MNNIIKAEWFHFKKTSLVLSVFILLTAYLGVFFGGLSADGKIRSFSAESLGKGSSMSIFIVSLIISAAISATYQNRLQLYEIMAGYRPNQIILGRTAFFVPLLVLFYLMPSSVVLIISDHSPQMIKTLVLFWTLCIRFVLCTVFLSPFFKEGAWVTSFSVLLVLIRPLYEEMYGAEASDKFRNSLLGLTTFVQCSFLDGDITTEYSVKVIISSVVSCIICYLIGYLTLKKKYSLEPHPIQ